MVHELGLEFVGGGWEGRGLGLFAEDDESEAAAAIHALDAPVEDLLGGVKGDKGALLAFVLPVDQGTGAANSDDFGDDLFGVTGEGGAQQICVIEELGQGGSECGMRSAECGMGRS